MTKVLKSFIEALKTTGLSLTDVAVILVGIYTKLLLNFCKKSGSVKLLLMQKEKTGKDIEKCVTVVHNLELAICDTRLKLSK
jgi:hypothetical protein